jgi:hypothetical protein
VHRLRLTASTAILPLVLTAVLATAVPGGAATTSRNVHPFTRRAAGAWVTLGRFRGGIGPDATPVLVIRLEAHQAGPARSV